LPRPHMGLVTVTEDAVRLWATWVGWGGEGIVLKGRRSPYRPALRTLDWLKVKHRHALTVRVVAGDPKLVRWGDWSWAVRLTLTYTHPQTKRRVRVEEVVRLPDPQDFTLRPGERGDVGVLGILAQWATSAPVVAGLGGPGDRPQCRGSSESPNA